MIDNRYATTDNVTGIRLYPANTIYLERSAAERLARVQDSLRRQGIGLKVFDGYRPLAIQKALWKVKPDPQYVADPAKGSRHNRGSAVDVTLVDAAGRERPMPSAFDEFSERSHLAFMDTDGDLIANRETLQKAMRSEGFLPLATEWWHIRRTRLAGLSRDGCQPLLGATVPGQPVEDGVAVTIPRALRPRGRLRRDPCRRGRHRRRRDCCDRGLHDGAGGEWADGDSFRVCTQAGEEHTVRLYGADCLEHHVNDETDARRLRSQRRYFGIAEAGSDTAASIEFAKRLGAEATAETRRLLAEPFTLHTSFADGRGDARFKRIYRLRDVDAKGNDLAASSSSRRA